MPDIDMPSSVSCESTDLGALRLLQEKQPLVADQGGLNPATGEVIHRNLLLDVSDRQQLIQLQAKKQRIKSAMDKAHSAGDTATYNGLAANYEQLSAQIGNKEAAIQAKETQGASSLQAAYSLDSTVTTSRSLSGGELALSSDGPAQVGDPKLVPPGDEPISSEKMARWYSSGYEVVLLETILEILSLMKFNKLTETDISIAYQKIERENARLELELGKEAAQAVRDKAQAQMIGAFVKAGLSVGGAVASSVFSMYSMKGGGDSHIVSGYVTAINAGFNAAGQVAESMFNLQGAYYEATTMEKNNKKELLQNMDRSMDSYIQNANKAREEAQEISNQFIEFLKKLLDEKSRSLSYSHVGS